MNIVPTFLRSLHGAAYVLTLLAGPWVLGSCGCAGSEPLGTEAPPSTATSPSSTPAAKDDLGPTPPEAAERNSAEALLAMAPRIDGVDILDLDTRQPRGSLTAEQLERVRASLQAGVPRDSFSATSPPWDVALRFQSPDESAVVALLVGERALRVNPREPFSSAWSDAEGQPLSGVREITVDETLYDILAARLGEPNKEYRPARPIDVRRLQGNGD